MKQDSGTSTATPVMHAVVIGGSIAGLTSARVLADHCTRVTIVERDQLAEATDGFPFRSGVPQGRHIHVLLASGYRALEHLFPGIGDELAAGGAVPIDWAADTHWVNFAGTKPRFASHIHSWASSRGLLEQTLRRRVLSIPNVQLLDGYDVTGLLTDTTGTRAQGVQLRRRGRVPVQTTRAPGQHQHAPEEATKAPEMTAAPAVANTPDSHDAYREREDRRGAPPVHELRADLVVDASGRTSRAPDWLAALGYPRPRETAINSFPAYATRTYALPADVPPEWKLLYLQVSPPGITRGGVVYPIEGGRWMVSLMGVGQDAPPTDETGFLAYTRSLLDPGLATFIDRARPLTPIYGYRHTGNQRRHYEHLPRYLECFLVTGDAACAFNPVYGQGITVAAQGALALNACLHEQQAPQAQRGQPEAVDGLAKRFQRRLAQVLTTPWLLATAEDFRVPETVGGRPGVLTRLLHRYMDRVMYAGSRDPAVHLVVGEVFSLLTPPTALFHPRIVWRVLRAGSAVSTPATPMRTSSS